MQEINNIVNLFFEATKKHPNKIAIIDNDKSITFYEFEQQVKSTAAYFLKKGIKKGDRIMVFVPMSIDLYRIVLAIFYMGATAVFLDEWVNKKRMEACCKIAQCQAFIGILKARLFTYFSSELRKIPIKLGTNHSNIFPTINSDTTVNITDTALITFTTGSTGTPKAAKRTHYFLHQQFNALLEKINPQADDIDMPVLPIVLLINLGTGSTSVIAPFKASKPELMDAKKILNLINTYNVNRIVASPFFIKQLAKYIVNTNERTDCLKKIFTGGAPVFPNEAELYYRAFPNTETEIVYGSTEAEPISSINVKELIKNKETLLHTGLNVGAIYRKAEVKIIKMIDAPITCASEDELQKLVSTQGEIGEIIVSGPHVLREYFNNVDALKRNKIFIKDVCWHRTGDSGYKGDDGILYLTGRCNTLINIDTKIIAPFIYENYFQTIKDVEIGTILDLNKKIIVIIEPKEEYNKQVIEKQLMKIDITIDEIKFVSKIPRDPRHNSKIDYELLRKNYF